MIYTKTQKSGLTWHDLCELIKTVTGSGGGAAQDALIKARVSFRGRLTSISIDTGADDDG
ncbi:hypothetical protein ACH4FX_12050 [Streptomyces sp. NPDC018019]|uniref:hypothetical protein n=1 Tax=Streptomyces sp. NPDC018019 TaxID=3365030 RepID=UPI0037A0E66C